ncbi:MAG TPA: hypothetical protein VHU87_00155 [Rhizomicrobium sp.]|jgi:hypothetical protein|nr:hypothetical protein [Rhizomicrobium sp.]
MNLQSFVSLSEIVSALSVTLTLVVLVVSIRQNTKSQRVLAVQSLSAAIAAINVPAMESPALGSALAKATRDWGSASRDERILAHFFLFSYFKLVETAWYQRRAGALEEEQWAGWDTVMRIFYHSDGVKLVWWPNRGYAFSPAFRDYLAQTKPPAEVGALHDIFGDPKPG